MDNLLIDLFPTRGGYYPAVRLQSVNAYEM